jgi:hypothetical protein
MSNYRNGPRRSTIPAEISGLQVTLQRRSKRERAALAASIRGGEARLGKLTQAQAARLCGVSASYVQQVQRANTIVQTAAE